MMKEQLLKHIESQVRLFSEQRGPYKLPEEDISLLTKKWAEHYNRPVGKLVVQVPITGPPLTREFSDTVLSEIPPSKQAVVRKIIDEIVSVSGGHIRYTHDDKVGKVVVVSPEARIAALRLKLFGKLLGIKSRKDLGSACMDEGGKTGAHELEIKLAYYLLPQITKNSKSGVRTSPRVL